MEFLIREYRKDDAAALRACVVELQEFERTLDARLPSGEEMATAYCENIQARCREADGRIFVAECAGTVVGFVAVLAHEPFTEPDDPPGTRAVIADLVVLSAWRNGGMGRKLLDHAEAYVRSRGARELRIEVLSRNDAARALYHVEGYVPYLEVFVKRWSAG